MRSHDLTVLQPCNGNVLPTTGLSTFRLGRFRRFTTPLPQIVQGKVLGCKGSNKAWRFAILVNSPHRRSSFDCGATPGHQLCSLSTKDELRTLVRPGPLPWGNVRLSHARLCDASQPRPLKCHASNRFGGAWKLGARSQVMCPRTCVQRDTHDKVADDT